MKKQISKELLSEILNKDVVEVDGFTHIHLPNNLFYFINGNIIGNMNIYELAHKCKEWALSKGYIINSGATTSNDWSSTIYKVIKENPYIKELSHTCGQSENEAIFKACQWILDKDSK